MPDADRVERDLADDREAAIDRLIIDAYTRRPQDDIWTDEAARRLIAEEPW